MQLIVNNSLTFTTPPGNNLIKQEKVKFVFKKQQTNIINYHVNTLMLIFLYQAELTLNTAEKKFRKILFDLHVIKISISLSIRWIIY